MLTEEDVTIAQQHVFYLIVCAAKDATIEEIERVTNNQVPSGVSSPWKVVEGKVFTGTEIKHPSPCDEKPDRLHYELRC